MKQQKATVTQDTQVNEQQNGLKRKQMFYNDQTGLKSKKLSVILYMTSNDAISSSTPTFGLYNNNIKHMCTSCDF